MIEEQAIVVSVNEHETWVETQRQSACGQCSVNKGCGTSLLSQHLGNKSTRIRVINRVSAKPGDRVLIGLPEDAFLRGAMMTYLIPLLLMLLFAIVASYVSTQWLQINSEALVILCAFTGFGLGMLLLSRFSQRVRSNSNYQPVILKTIVYPENILIGM